MWVKPCFSHGCIPHPALPENKAKTPGPSEPQNPALPPTWPVASLAQARAQKNSAEEASAGVLLAVQGAHHPTGAFLHT